MGTAVARNTDRTPARNDAQRDARTQLRDALSRYSESFAKVLPKHMTPDRVVALTLLAATKQPDLYECTPESIAAAMMRVSQWGLELGTTAHLLVFNEKYKDAQGRDAWRKVVQPVTDYKGLIQLVIESGHVRDIFAEAVYEHDFFRACRGSEPRIEHEPAWNQPDRGKIVAYYAVAILRFQRTTFDVMRVDEVEAIRQRSKAKDKGPWVTDPVEMGKKTVIRRLCKRLPQQSTKLQAALGADDEVVGSYEITDGTSALRAPAGPRALITTGYDGYGDDAAATSTAPAPAEPDRTSAGGQGSRVRPSPAASGAQSEAPTLIDEPARAPRPTSYRTPAPGRVVDALEQTRGLDMARRVASDPDPYEHGEPGEMSDEEALALDDARKPKGRNAIAEGR